MIFGLFSKIFHGRYVQFRLGQAKNLQKTISYERTSDLADKPISDFVDRQNSNLVERQISDLVVNRQLSELADRQFSDSVERRALPHGQNDI